MRARTSRQTTELPLARAFGCALTAVLEPAQILSTVPGGIDVVIVKLITWLESPRLCATPPSPNLAGEPPIG